MIPRLHPDFLSKPLAHRGFHDVSEGRAENSRAAVRAAINHGYGIEIDIQPSQNGRPMVFHDYALDRLTPQSGLIRQKTTRQLQNIPLNGSTETIPDLAEILAIVDARIPLLIEIKDQDGAMGKAVGPLEHAIFDIVKSYQGPLGLMSFNPHSVACMAQLLPQVPRGLVTSAYRFEEWPLPEKICDHLRKIPDYERVRASFVSHEVNDLHGNARIEQLKSAGCDILCWTVTSPQQEAQARQVADNITFEQYHAQT